MGLAIEASSLERWFGSTKALDRLHLAVVAGTVFGLLGPNGAGKTTAVRVFTTLLRPDGGWARVVGYDVVADAPEVRRRIGLAGQYAALDESLTGRANLVMVGQLCRLSGRQARKRADELLSRFDLTDAAGRGVKTYSGGMRRRLDLAASLIARPEVLFLDEPTTGLDPRSRLVMWGVIRSLAADGTTVLLTTQYLDEADQLADHVAVVDQGRVIAEGSPDVLKASVGGELIRVKVAPESDLQAAGGVLARHGSGPVQVDVEHRTVAAPFAVGARQLPDVVVDLSRTGILLDDLAIVRPSLDDVFLTLTGHAVMTADTDEPKEAARA